VTKLTHVSLKTNTMVSHSDHFIKSVAAKQ